MSAPPPRDSPATTDRGAAADARAGALVISVLLITAAVLDLSRCGIVLVTARHGPPAAGLVFTGLGAAALSLAAARGSCRGRRWADWAALLIGAASAPQAAAIGFRELYEVPDTATAAVGILLMVAVLATAGPAWPSGQVAGNPCRWAGGPSRAAGRTPDSARRAPPYHRMGASGADRRDLGLRSRPGRCAP
jgi:hypothetical protein